MWVEILPEGFLCLNALVILFVRMWVEMMLRRQRMWSLGSSSSWGCELKCFKVHFICATVTVILFVRMWVEIIKDSTRKENKWVILFVRMWVEIFYMNWSAFWRMSSSSWGCELKSLFSHVLFGWMMSSSSWGCELKYFCNSFLLHWVLSSSSWGCELKYPS